MTRPVGEQPGDASAARAALIHRRVLCVFTMIMMALSWPIWHTAGPIPRFPVAGLSSFTAGFSNVDPYALVITVFGLVLSLTRRFGRLGAGLLAASGLFLVLIDQQRLQAWFYQTLVLSAVYALLPGSSAVGFARFFAVALYFHSAVSKLDWSFAHSMGPYLLSPILDILPGSLAPGTEQAIVIALPVGEMLAAAALAMGYWRAGLAGVTIMHVALLVLLGPWLLDHSGNVLTWNVSMFIQAWILFRRPLRAESIEEMPTTPSVPQPSPALGLVQLGMMAVAILPFFERSGLWDPWPSFALYAGHVEQMRIDWPAELKDRIPADFQPFLTPVGDDLALDLTLWSRARFGVPPYPAERIQRKLAAWIADTCPERMPMRAIFLSKAHWRTGLRRETIFKGREAVRNLR